MSEADLIVLVCECLARTHHMGTMDAGLLLDVMNRQLAQRRGMGVVLDASHNAPSALMLVHRGLLKTNDLDRTVRVFVGDDGRAAIKAASREARKMLRARQVRRAR